MSDQSLFLTEKHRHGHSICMWYDISKLNFFHQSAFK